MDYLHTVMLNGVKHLLQILRLRYATLRMTEERSVIDKVAEAHAKE